jgi:hypothetical protein
MSEIIRWWTTCEDGIHTLDIAPPNKGNWVRYADHLAAISALEDECKTSARQAKIAERWAERYRMCVEFLKHPGEPSAQPVEWSRQLIEELSAAETQVVVLKEALKIACADAWPNQPQWPALYEGRAAENIQTAPKEVV